MELHEFLQAHVDAIVLRTVKGVSKAEIGHYARLGPGGVEQKLRDLLGKVIDGARTRHLDSVVEHAERIGNERYESGFDFVEVQGVISLLEQAIWLAVLDEYPRDEVTHALGMVATLLGAAKDRLACTYLSRATSTQVASLDLQRLFGGTQNTGSGPSD